MMRINWIIGVIVYPEIIVFLLYIVLTLYVEENADIPQAVR